MTEPSRSRGHETDDPGPRTTRVVADADVLAADLLVGGSAREALTHVRRHSWMTLLVSDALLEDAVAVIATLADDSLATDWRHRVEREADAVAHPTGDHPGLATAYRGSAGHLLTFDEELTSARTNLSVQSTTALSVRVPDSFARLFDAATLYESIHDEAYPGPDRQV